MRSLDFTLFQEKKELHLILVESGAVVPVVGLEPTRGISPTDFESVTSTIPSHRLLKIAADESAATLELDARFELATS